MPAGCFDDPQTDLEKFCCDPSSVVTDEATANYYRRVCEAREEAHDTWQDQLDQFGENLSHLPENLIMAILSPEGLEMIGLTLGIELTGTVALNAMLRAIAAGVGKEVMESAAAMAAKEGAVWINNVILTTVVANAVKEGTVAALAFRLTRTLASAASVVATALAIVGLLGMILDVWDPEGYGQEINAEAMSQLSRQFDLAFQSAFMQQVPVGQDVFGRPVYPTEWPIEYNVPPPPDDEAPRRGLRTERARLRDQSAMLWPYIVAYLDALEYNSDGFPIARPPGGDLLFPDWGALADKIFLRWTSGNTVATNYLHEGGRRLIGWLGVAAFALYVLAGATSRRDGRG